MTIYMIFSTWSPNIVKGVTQSKALPNEIVVLTYECRLRENVRWIVVDIKVETMTTITKRDNKEEKK